MPNINFPVTSTTGTTYTFGDRTWTWNGRAWQAISTTVGYVGSMGITGSTGYIGSKGESSYIYSSSAPISPAVGDRWFNSDYGLELVWTNDGDSAQWVEIAASGFVGAAGYTGSAGLFTSNQTIVGYIESVTALSTVGASATLVITAGTILTATLTSATPCTFTMPTPTAGLSFILMLKQPASGTPTTAAFTSVKWNVSGAPTITATVGKMDLLTFVADGTNWYGAASQGYTP